MAHLNVGIDVKARVGDALRGIAQVKLALRGLRQEHDISAERTAYLNKQTSLLNKSLEKQSKSTKALTGNYFSLRRVLLTFTVRTAIAGLTALTAAMNSAGVSAFTLIGSLANLGAAGGIGGVATIGAAFQGLAVLSLAWSKNLTKALTTSGKTFEKAMAKLTKPARDFVVELKSMRTVWDQLTLLSQKGLFPGLVKGLEALKPLIDPVKHAVYDTAQMLGYLGQRLGEMGGKRTGEFERFFSRNIKTIERMGRSLENFGFAFIALSNLTGPLVGHMTKDVEKFSKSVLRFFEDKKHKKDIQSFFGNFRQSWDDWTSILGSVAKTLFNVWDAIQPVIHRVDKAIGGALKQASEWTADNKSGIRKYFQDSLAPMGAFLKLLGGLAKIWVDFSVSGNDNAVRFFDGLRTKLIPVLKDFLEYLGGNIFPKMMDLGGAILEFVHSAAPGIKGLLSLFKPFADTLIFILGTGQKIIDLFSFNKITSTLATLMVTATILTSWKKLKDAIKLTVLTTRGLAGVPGAVLPTSRNFSSLIPGSGIYRGTQTAVRGIRNLPSHAHDVFYENVDRGALVSGVAAPVKQKVTASGIILPPGYRDKLSKTTSSGVSGGFKSFFTKPTGFFRSMFGLGGFGPALALTAAPILVSVLVAALRDTRPKIIKMFDDLKPEPGKSGPGTVPTGSTNQAIRKRVGLITQDPRIKSLQEQLAGAIKSGDFEKMQRIAKALQKIGDAAQDAGKRSQISKIVSDIGTLQAQTQGKLIGQVAPDFENFYHRGDTSLTGIKDGLAVLQGQLTAKLPGGSRIFKSAMSDSFGAAAAAVAANMDAIGKKTKAGMDLLNRLLVKQLTELGFSKAQAKNIVIDHQRYDGGPNEGGPRKITPEPTYHGPHAIGGGFYVGRKGDRGRDTIPMQVGNKSIVAGSGEYVGIFNHQQQKAFEHMSQAQGYGSMEGFFRGNSRPHYMSVGGITKLGHEVQGMGPYTVGENSHFGGVHPVHVKNSLHYRDEALDINADSAPGGEKKWLDKLAAKLMGEGWHVLWQVPGHYDHLHVDDATGNGALGNTLAAHMDTISVDGKGVAVPLIKSAVDLVQAAMQSTLDSVQGSLSGGSENEGAFMGAKTGGSASANMNIAKQMMNSFGWGPEEWPAWQSLGMGESGWLSTALNSGSGAFGIGQFLGGTKDAYAKYGATSNDPFWQINAMGHYIKDRYGTPSRAYSTWLSRSPHWYAQGGVFEASAGMPPGATIAAAPPTVGGALPEVNPQLNPYDRPGTDAFGRPLKKPKKKKPPYKYTPPGGHPTLGAGYGHKNYKPKKKVKSKKPSKKALTLAKKHLKHPSLLYTDPITGEQRDLSLLRYDYLEGLIGDWGIDLSNLQDHQSLTEEQSIVTLDDGTDVVNSNGNVVNGKFIPGIQQFVDEQMAQLGIHEGRSIMGSPNKGIVGALTEEQGFLTALPTKKAIKEYHHRLSQVRKYVINKIRLRKKYNKKLKGLGGTFGYKKAIRANNDIITAWSIWKRDSRGESPAADRQADHEMDRLRGENNWLRDHKPSPSQIKGVAGGDTANKLAQVRADLKFLTGDADVVGWDPSAGGQVSILSAGLTAWHDTDDTKTTGLANLKSSLSTEQTEIQRIRNDIADWTGTKLPPAPKPDTSTSDEILKSIGEDVLKGNFLQGLQANVLNEFNPLLNARLIGAFAQGGVVPRTGMALVHKGEFINPAPDGGYRNGLNAAPNVNTGDTIVELHFKGNAQQLVDLVDSRVRKVAPGAINQSSGAQTRRIIAARGGSTR